MWARSHIRESLKRKRDRKLLVGTSNLCKCCGGRDHDGPCDLVIVQRIAASGRLCTRSIRREIGDEA